VREKKKWRRFVCGCCAKKKPKEEEGASLLCVCRFVRVLCQENNHQIRNKKRNRKKMRRNKKTGNEVQWAEDKPLDDTNHVRAPPVFVEMCKCVAVLAWRCAKRRKKKDGASNKMGAVWLGSEQKRIGTRRGNMRDTKRRITPSLARTQTRQVSKKQNALSHNHKTRIKKRNNRIHPLLSPLGSTTTHKNQEHGMN